MHVITLKGIPPNLVVDADIERLRGACGLSEPMRPCNVNNDHDPSSGDVI
jgi:hypothetical protein